MRFDLPLIVLFATLSHFAWVAEAQHPIAFPSECSFAPVNCEIVCPHGYVKHATEGCLCACAADPCQSNTCAIGEICIAVGLTLKCIPTLDHRPECPRLTAGVCALRCESDDDCHGRLVCCSNGCGRECVTPLSSFPIKAAKPIEPQFGPFDKLLTAVSSIKLANIIPQVQNSLRTVSGGSLFTTDAPIISPVMVVPKVKVGQCPSSAVDTRNCQKVNTCEDDADCENVQRCCSTSCGKSCTDPIKATTCVHLFLAVKKLPDGALSNKFVPNCAADGKFEPIQCDGLNCWCVDIELGTELQGTRRALHERSDDMCYGSPRSCPSPCSNVTCTHGFQLNEDGCPLAACRCRDVCEGVNCPLNGDTCQLIEPDCDTPPCHPVPRCLINPCPTAKPMKLQNGVTALCTHDEQCGDKHFCHQIGFNGLGFCCGTPRPATRAGTCSSRMPRKDTKCRSNCKIDDDCASGKCCFDGCGLSCQEKTFHPNPFKSTTLAIKKFHYNPGDVTRHNKLMLSSLVGDCPELTVATEKCATECRTDSDCQGMRRCCRRGCGTTCAYPVRSTPCFQLALTAELYSLRSAMKCDRAGNFEQKQCDDDGCFCVDISTGEPIGYTRVESTNVNCKATKQCDEITCRNACPFGYEKNFVGCPTCKCKNPCAELKCPQGSVCVVASVKCYAHENCSPQPRCIINLCPSGLPFTSSLGNTETCNANDQCPRDHTCHMLGLSAGGLCCPSAPKLTRPESCPKIPPAVDSHITCKLMCKEDGDCLDREKCCFDGCGTTCVEFTPAILPVTETALITTTTSREEEKPGACPYFDALNCKPNARGDECGSDVDCPGVQKCCSDGCRRICVYSERNTPCLQLKAALQQIGQMDRVKCRPDGSFEEVQCDTQFCWCVDSRGWEIEGTKTSEDIMPHCRGPRRCPTPLCTVTRECRFGIRKDSNGCNTCECHNICDGIICPDTSVCVPMTVNCLSGPCPVVPRCLVNPCPAGTPYREPSTFVPIPCQSTSQCVGTVQSSFCRVFHSSTDGYCCPGKAPRQHEGTCPSNPPPSGDCSRHCAVDTDCSTNHKCCYNGCGLSCLRADGLEVEAMAQEVHLGKCLQTKPLGAFCIQRSQSSECNSNADCPDMLLCCSDGCVKRCAPPAVTSQCIHARLSAMSLRDRNPSIFVPDCDDQGRFVQIQSHNGQKWCVDLKGSEITGTKGVGIPDCGKPRSCRVRSCSKHCSFGLRTDVNGCTICDCVNPCEMINCSAGSLCRMVQHQCLTTNCQAVPKCVPNVCSIGEPLEASSGLLAECGDGVPCPTNYYCHRSGFEGKGLCCMGTQPASTIPMQCADLPQLRSSVDNSSCVVSCRREGDCPQSKCCFNGCGTSCQFVAATIKPTVSHSEEDFRTSPIISVDSNTLDHASSNRSTFGVVPLLTSMLSNSLNAVLPSTNADELLQLLKLGTCPRTIINPGCKEMCAYDNDCDGYNKCCAAGCGTVCIEPKTTTACIHRLLTFQREGKRASSLLPPPVQCTADGSFRKHQCDIVTKTCWCVDAAGYEKVGTRTNSEGPLPNCDAPKLCSTSCNGFNCAFGIQLDLNGCPQNSVCNCRNPCNELNCAVPGQVCQLAEVSCLDDTLCPRVPKCVPRLCPEGSYLKDEFNNPAFCTSDDDCHGRTCITMGHDVVSGFCCKNASSESNVVAPESSTPAHEFVIQAQNPTRTIHRRPRKTNCTAMVSAIETLLNGKAAVRLVSPSCHPFTGLFERVQCNKANSCWCVDVHSGIEVHGTRTSNARHLDVCAAPRICAHHCPPNLCVFGFVLDSMACPREDCACKSPCDSVECHGNEICILRQVPSADETLTNIPMCEPTPCNVGHRPIVEQRTRQQFSCSAEDHCPSGFYCTGFDVNRKGVCCPGKEPLLLSTKSKAPTCPHGDPLSFSNEGNPILCTATDNGCPSTHYCSTQPGRRKGVCCVSKRHVCNLQADRGPCSVSVLRYHYSAPDNRCIPFDYGGCAGNLNNFATLEDCQAFCSGLSTEPFMLDDGVDDKSESFQVGFSLTGPMLEREQMETAKNSLAAFLVEHFDIPESSIRDVSIHSDNAVSFTLSDVEAREMARKISESVSNGKMALSLEGLPYKAEPQTLYAKHIVSESRLRLNASTLFWLMIAVAVALAVAMVLILCNTCLCMCRERSKASTSNASSRSSDFRSNSIVTERMRVRPSVGIHRQATVMTPRVRFPSRATSRSVGGSSLTTERAVSASYYV